MPKLKAQEKPPQISKSVQQFLEGYDAVSLQSALNTFEGSLGWDLMKAFMQFQAANYVGYSIHLAQKTGSQFESCAAGAKAEMLRDMADLFMIQLRNKVGGRDGLVSDEVPQE